MNTTLVPIFMNMEHTVIILVCCGGLVEVAALLLGIFFGEIHKAESGKQL